MISNANAITAAAAYVAENEDVFNAAYTANRGKTRGASSRAVRQALRDAVAGGRDEFGTVRLAATWLAGSEYLDGAVRQGTRNGTLPAGTTTEAARRFLSEALGVKVQPPLVAQVRQEAPVQGKDALRDEFKNAIAGKTGQVKITIEGAVEDLSELLGL